jgi:hypothetical protein
MKRGFFRDWLFSLILHPLCQIQIENAGNNDLELIFFRVHLFSAQQSHQEILNQSAA